MLVMPRPNVAREIWTDGRALPSDPDPLWYGYSTGKWVDDFTFVIESTGYDDRTWWVLPAETGKTIDGPAIFADLHDNIEAVFHLD
jgi:hypothetical protein